MASPNDSPLLADNQSLQENQFIHQQRAPTAKAQADYNESQTTNHDRSQSDINVHISAGSTNAASTASAVIDNLLSHSPMISFPGSPHNGNTPYSPLTALHSPMLKDNSPRMKANSPRNSPMLTANTPNLTQHAPSSFVQLQNAGDEGQTQDFGQGRSMSLPVMDSFDGNQSRAALFEAGKNGFGLADVGQVNQGKNGFGFADVGQRTQERSFTPQAQGQTFADQLQAQGQLQNAQEQLGFQYPVSVYEQQRTASPYFMPSSPFQGHSSPFQGHSSSFQGHSSPFQGAQYDQPSQFQAVPSRFNSPFQPSSPFQPHSSPFQSHSSPFAQPQSQFAPESQWNPDESRTHIASSDPLKPFACPHPGCGREFARTQNLRSHSRCHLLTAPHGCKVCGLGFRRTTDLQRHVRTMHTPERLKPWPCERCGRRFGRSDALKRHVSSRSKEHGCSGVKTQSVPGVQGRGGMREEDEFVPLRG
jgi:Zinc finger, C2H2 type/C2H2-type zinc finger